MYTNICITKTFSNKTSKFIHNKDWNFNIIYLFIQIWVFESLFMLPVWVLWVLVRCAVGWLVEYYIHPRAIHPTCQDSILGEVPGGLRGGIPCRLWGGNRGRLRCGIQGRLWGGIRGIGYEVGSGVGSDVGSRVGSEVGSGVGSEVGSRLVSKEGTKKRSRESDVPVSIVYNYYNI
jgi:hypothetical protein